MPSSRAICLELRCWSTRRKHSRSRCVSSSTGLAMVSDRADMALPVNDGFFDPSTCSGELGTFALISFAVAAALDQPLSAWRVWLRPDAKEYPSPFRAAAAPGADQRRAA